MVAGTLLPAAFSLAELAASDRVWIKRAAAQIRWHVRRTCADMLAIGRVLVQARERLGTEGLFGRWVDSQIELRPRTVRRLMQVYRVFGTLKPEVANQFDKKVLYSLAQPDVPQPFREFVVEQAADGKPITSKELAVLLADHCDKSKAPISLASTKDPKRDIDADDVFAAANWRLLMGLWADGASLLLDSSHDGDEQLFSILRLAAGPRTVVCKSPEECLLAISGENRMKTCSTCEKPKTPNEFSRQKNSRDGRNRRCLACERDRVKKDTARKRETVES